MDDLTSQTLKKSGNSLINKNEINNVKNKPIIKSMRKVMYGTL